MNKTRAFINLFKVSPDGEKKLSERFEVDVTKAWEVKPISTSGVIEIHFFPINSEDPVVRLLGSGVSWSLGYQSV